MKGYTAATRSGTRQVTFISTVPSIHQYTIQNRIPNPNRAGNGPKAGIAKVISRIAGPASTGRMRLARLVAPPEATAVVMGSSFESPVSPSGRCEEAQRLVLCLMDKAASSLSRLFGHFGDGQNANLDRRFSRDSASPIDANVVYSRGHRQPQDQERQPRK